MSQTGLYGPSTFQRNLTIANLVLTLDAAGAAPVVTKDKGLVVSTVVWDGGQSTWTVTLKDTYLNGVDVTGFTLSRSAGQNLIVELNATTTNSFTFKLFDLDVAGGGAGAAYVAGDVTAHISLDLAA